MTERATQPRFRRPPIEEVICGFIFDPLPVDALDCGVYWDSRIDDFPQKEIHSALLENVAELELDAPLTRAWLISTTNDFIVQLQSDRFYMNWRRSEGAYPRFSDHENKVGLKTRAVAEFQKFADFCETRISRTPTLKRLELTKIDVLRQGTHYSDQDDLGRMLKVARVFKDIQTSAATRLHLQLDEHRDEGNSVRVAITVGTQSTRIETRTLFMPGQDLDDSFHTANRRINDVFFGLLDPEELHRFDREVSI